MDRPAHRWRPFAPDGSFCGLGSRSHDGVGRSRVHGSDGNRGEPFRRRWNLAGIVDADGFRRRSIGARRAFRDLDGQSAVVIFNAGHEAAVHDLDLLSTQDEGRTFTDVWQTGEYTVQAGKLTRVHVPARQAVVLVTG